MIGIVVSFLLCGVGRRSWFFRGERALGQSAGHELGHKAFLQFDGESLIDLVEHTGQGDAHGQLDELVVREMRSEERRGGKE